MKQAFIREGDHFRWTYKPVEVTGLCKKREGGFYLNEHFVQVQRRIFGIRCGTYWVDREYIVFREPIVETIYKCTDETE